MVLNEVSGDTLSAEGVLMPVSFESVLLGVAGAVLPVEEVDAQIEGRDSAILSTCREGGERGRRRAFREGGVMRSGEGGVVGK